MRPRKTKTRQLIGEKFHMENIEIGVLLLKIDWHEQTQDFSSISDSFSDHVHVSMILLKIFASLTFS